MRERLAEIDAKADAIALDKGEAVLDYASKVDLLRKMHTEVIQATILAIEARSEVDELKKRNSDVQQLLEARGQEVVKLDDLVKKLVKDGKNLVAKMQELNAKADQENDELVEMSNDIEEQNPDWVMDDLNAEIESCNARMNLLHEGDPTILQQFEHRAQKIQKLEELMSRTETELQELQERITEIREQWEPQLDNLVAQISEAFSYNFQKIGCAGQVGVGKEEEFSEWSIQIQVKFR